MGLVLSIPNGCVRMLVPQPRAWVHIRLCTVLRGEQLSYHFRRIIARPLFFFVAMVLFHALLEGFPFSRHLARVSSTLDCVSCS